jgi:hypothetical protein
VPRFQVDPVGPDGARSGQEVWVLAPQPGRGRCGSAASGARHTIPGPHPNPRGRATIDAVFLTSFVASTVTSHWA